jgi:pullulanase
MGAVDGGVTLGQWHQLVAGSGTNFSINFDLGDYTFLVDASDAAAPMVSVFKSLLFGDTSVFVRGDMNGWGTDNALVYLGDGIYSTDIDLAVGDYDYEFKFASEDWSSFNLGADANADIEIGNQYNQIQGSNGILN